MVSSTLGWAVGNGGTILHWNGTNWTNAASPTSQLLNAIAMVSANSGWAVGWNGTIIRYQNGGWQNVASPTGNTLWAITMLSSTDGWAVGNGGTILHWNGSQWKLVPSPIAQQFFTISMLSSTQGWIAGYDNNTSHGIMLRWNGSTWSNVSIPALGRIFSVAMNSPSDGWAVAESSWILHWNGSNWSNWTNPATPDAANTGILWLSAVRLASANNGWAVGGYVSASELAHWDGSRWTAVPSPVTTWLQAIAMVSDTIGWAVGRGGTILRYTAPSVAPKPVVVLVHGWHGTQLSPETTCNTGIVPYTANYPTDFGIFPSQLQADGFFVYVAHLDTSFLSTPAVESNARCLQTQISEVRNLAPGGKVILIAHSMGGLVSRAYLESSSFQNDVSRLITLGTPHTGTSWGYIGLQFCGLDLAVCEFTPLGMSIFNTALHPHRAAGVEYTFIGGDKTPTMGLPLKVCDGPNDGAVGAYSATGKYYDPCLLAFTPTTTVDGIANRYVVHATHPTGSNIQAGDYPSYFRLANDSDPSLTEAYLCVEKVLGVSNRPNAKCPVPAVDTPAAADSSTTYAPVAAFTGHLGVSQTFSAVVPINTTGFSVIGVNWNSGLVSLTVKSPTGLIFDPAYATAHPDQVSYTEYSDDPGSTLFEGYSISPTMAGYYTLTVIANEADPAGLDFGAFALVDTSPQMTLATDQMLYSIGSQATITANLTSGSGGLAGAAVQASFYQSGTVSNTVTLIDRGGGVYTGTYAIPNAPGYIDMAVRARGSLAGRPFQRQYNTTLAIEPATVGPAGSYSDTAVDADNNHFYEALDIQVGLNVAASGNYLLSADLEASGNNIIAHGVVSVTLSGGVVTATIPFRGDDLRASGLDGPYTLTNLTMLDSHFESVPSIWLAPTAWQTQAWRYKQFGTYWNAYLPIALR